MSEQTITDVANVQAFFNERLNEVMAQQGLELRDGAMIYLVNLLTEFSDSRNLFEQTPDGYALRPLAEQYADAVNAPNAEERNAALKHLGDVALFISGVFSGSLNRKLVDVDYYIAMGGSAYSYLADIFDSALFGRARGEVFGELSAKFNRLVDVLDEFAEGTSLSSNTDVMRSYEVWMRTGSPRALEKLRRQGVIPVASRRPVVMQ